MLADAHGYVAQAWWTVGFPGLAITLWFAIGLRRELRDTRRMS